MKIRKGFFLAALSTFAHRRRKPGVTRVTDSSLAFLKRMIVRKRPCLAAFAAFCHRRPQFGPTGIADPSQFGVLGMEVREFSLVATSNTDSNRDGGLQGAAGIVSAHENLLFLELFWIRSPSQGANAHQR